MQRPVALFVLIALLAAGIGAFISLRGSGHQSGPGGSPAIAEGEERFFSHEVCQATLMGPPAAMRSVVIKHDGSSRTERYEVPMAAPDAIRVCGDSGVRATFWTAR